MSNIYIANDLNQTVHVMVSPSPGWKFVDFVADVGLLFTGVGELKLAVTTARGLPATVRTIKELGSYLKLVALVLSGGLTTSSRSVAAAKKLVQIFQENSTPIGAGEVKNVYGSNVWTYFNPSAYAAMLDADTMTLSIMSNDGKNFMEFDTNTDYSWIITSAGAVRAEYGRLWVPDPASGSHSWTQQR